MENKYLNEAIIGNKKIIATFTSKGEMQRIYFPSKDNRQYINYFHTGVKINESDLIYLHDDINNTYKQYYDTDTNILNTEITNTYFNLKIVQTDFILIKENVLLKRYTFLNEGKIDSTKILDYMLINKFKDNKYNKTEITNKIIIKYSILYSF